MGEEVDIVQLWISYKQLPRARRELEALHARADGNGPLLLAVVAIAMRMGDAAYARSMLPAAVRSFAPADHRGKSNLYVVACRALQENVPLLTDLLSSIDLVAIDQVSDIEQLLGAVQGRGLAADEQAIMARVFALDPRNLRLHPALPGAAAAQPDFLQPRNPPQRGWWQRLGRHFPIRSRLS